MRNTIFIISMFFLALSTFSLAEVVQLNYKATFGIFGTVGTIKNRVQQDENTYQIETTVELAGIAKLIMGGQTEYYISKGHMENHLMVSDYYQMTSTKKNKIVKKTYQINHQKKSVIKRYQKWIKGKLVENTEQKLKFYAKNDLLTLYFNLGNAVHEKGKTYLFKAVGLEKQKGKVLITVPDGKKSDAYKKDLGDAMLYAKALIHQKNFRKKKGDILLAIAKDGYITKSVIKDILLFGDAKLIRVKSPSHVKQNQ